MPESRVEVLHTWFRRPESRAIIILKLPADTTAQQSIDAHCQAASPIRGPRSRRDLTAALTRNALPNRRYQLRSCGANGAICNDVCPIRHTELAPLLL